MAERDREWEREGDEYFWENGDMCCAILRNGSKSLCGYVGIRPYHPLYKIKYSDEVPCLKDKLEKLRESPVTEDSMYFSRILSCLGGQLEPTPEIVLDCHGGLTYSRDKLPRGEEGKEYEFDKQNLWWFGFDCAHHMDYCPGTEEFMDKLRQEGKLTDYGHQHSLIYRNVEYVRAHIEVLCGQLAEILKEYGGNKVDKTERSDLI
jgi:hypothetical protein